MAFFDAQFFLYDSQLFHAFRPITIAFIKILKSIPLFRSPKAPAVKHYYSVTFSHKGRINAVPNLGAAKTMVHEDNDFTFTINLIINLEMIDWHECSGLPCRFS